MAIYENFLSLSFLSSVLFDYGIMHISLMFMSMLDISCGSNKLQPSWFTIFFIKNTINNLTGIHIPKKSFKFVIKYYQAHRKNIIICRTFSE